MKLKEILPLLEARKNPKSNPKISAYEQLLPYKDNPNCYIHFSNYNILGIYNISEYDTPLGIYGYPLKEIWEHYNINDAKSFYSLPFASERKYIHLFEWNGKGKFIDDFDQYSSTDLENDINSLKTIYEKSIVTNADSNDLYNLYYDIIDELSNIINYPENEINNEYNTDILQKMRNRSGQYKPININDFKLFPSLSLDRVKDPEYIKHIPVLKSKIKKYNNGIMSYQFNDIIRISRKESNNKFGYISVLWNICRYLANYGISPDTISNKYYMHYNKNSKTNVNKDLPKNWNILFRKLGYAGFCDNGTGYIHPNEPIQCVFMGMTFINRIKLIYNQDFGNVFNNYDDALSYINFKFRSNNNILSDEVTDYLRSSTKNDMHKKSSLFIAIAYALQNNDLSTIDTIIKNDKAGKIMNNDTIIKKYEKYYEKK